jgi:hypothetical protein
MIEQTEGSETSAYKIQTPRNYPEESIQYQNRHQEVAWEGKDWIDMAQDGDR